MPFTMSSQNKTLILILLDHFYTNVIFASKKVDLFRKFTEFNTFMSNLVYQK